MEVAVRCATSSAVSPSWDEARGVQILSRKPFYRLVVKNKATVADNRPRFRLARRSALRTFPQTELAMIWIVTWAIREPGMLDVVASRNLVASLPLASDQLTEAMVRNYLKRLLSTVFAEGGC